MFNEKEYKLGITLYREDEVTPQQAKMEYFKFQRGENNRDGMPRSMRVCAASFIERMKIKTPQHQLRVTMETYQKTKDDKRPMVVVQLLTPDEMEVIKESEGEDELE